MENRGEKIGILGGTFDPIHTGHLLIGEAAYEQFGLDTVFFMPAGNPPHKPESSERASDEDRAAMVELAIAENPHFALFDWELLQDGPSYTYITLERLKQQNPRNEYFFIIGEDSLRDFNKWVNPGRIAAAASLLTAVRDDDTREEFEHLMALRNEEYHYAFHRLNTPNIGISSTMIRQKVRAGESIRYYVPESVRRYILSIGLYR